MNATEKRKNITFRALNGKFRRLENNELSDILLKPMEHSTPLPHSPKHETLEFIKRFARLQLIAEPALACGLRIQMVSPRRNVLNAQNGLHEKNFAPRIG